MILEMIFCVIIYVLCRLSDILNNKVIGTARYRKSIFIGKIATEFSRSITQHIMIAHAWYGPQVTIIENIGLIHIFKC